MPRPSVAAPAVKRLSRTDVPPPGSGRNGSAPNAVERPGTRPVPPPRAASAQPPGNVRDARTEFFPAPVPPSTDDEPTGAPDEVPGRHRLLPAEPPEPRPAASYATADAGGRKARSGRRRRPTFWRELPLLVVVALLLTFLIQTFLAKVYVIPSGSMETTLHGCTGCNNDRVLVDKITYRFSKPEPGDVVVFRGPDSWSSEVSFTEPSNPLIGGLQQLGSLIGLAPPDEKDFVKRVIAVGGQTVQCCDSRNRVLVDGEPLEEPYIYYLPEAGLARQRAFGPIRIPEGELWMMGDSRNNSADSREPDHGPVPVANVIGKARLIVLPFPRFRWVDAVDPHAEAVGMPAPDAGEGAAVALGVLGVLPLALRRRSHRLDAEDLLPGFPRR